MLNVAEKKKTIKSRGINNNCPAKGSREIERNRCCIAGDEDGKLQVIGSVGGCRMRKAVSERERRQKEYLTQKVKGKVSPTQLPNE